MAPVRLGTLAVGAQALGAPSRAGALAVWEPWHSGALVIGRLVIRRTRISRLEIDQLVVRDLRVTDSFLRMTGHGRES